MSRQKPHAETATAALRRIAGLGINVTEIYPEGRPYLKGAFNALEAWRGWHDVDGWRLQRAEDALRDLTTRGASQAKCQADYHEHVRITDELLVHVRGLLKLFHTEEPLTVPVCPMDKGKLRYHVGDALAKWFAAGT